MRHRPPPPPSHTRGVQAPQPFTQPNPSAPSSALTARFRRSEAQIGLHARALRSPPESQGCCSCCCCSCCLGNTCTIRTGPTGATWSFCLPATGPLPDLLAPADLVFAGVLWPLLPPARTIFEPWLLPTEDPDVCAQGEQAAGAHLKAMFKWCASAYSTRWPCGAGTLLNLLACRCQWWLLHRRESWTYGGSSNMRYAWSCLPTCVSKLCVPMAPQPPLLLQNLSSTRPAQAT